DCRNPLRRRVLHHTHDGRQPAAQGIHRGRSRWAGQPHGHSAGRIRRCVDRGDEHLLHRPLLHASCPFRDSHCRDARPADRPPGARRLIRKARRVVGAAVVVVLAIFLPQLITGAYYQNLAILALLYAVVASNWDLTIGYAGLFNFAHIAFFGLGAYVSGVLTTKYGISPWLGIAAAVGVCVVVSTAIAFPATRLR